MEETAPGRARDRRGALRGDALSETLSFHSKTGARLKRLRFPLRRKSGLLERCAEAGVSIWPEHVTMQLSSDDPVSEVQQELAFIGYPLKQTGYMDEATKEALVAFQRRFRPSDISGVMDDETRYLLIAVGRMVK